MRLLEQIQRDIAEVDRQQAVLETKRRVLMEEIREIAVQATAALQAAA